MRQIYLTLLLAVMSSFASQTASAYDFEVDGVYYNLNTSDMTVYVTSNPNKYSGDVYIPKIVNYKGRELKVTGIGEHAFQYTNITSVTTDADIKFIEDDAFYGCENLKKLPIFHALNTIGRSAFAECANIEELIIPSSTYEIEYEAFADAKIGRLIFEDSNGTIIMHGCNRHLQYIEYLYIGRSGVDLCVDVIGNTVIGKACKNFYIYDYELRDHNYVDDNTQIAKMSIMENNDSVSYKYSRFDIDSLYLDRKFVSPNNKEGIVYEGRYLEFGDNIVDVEMYDQKYTDRFVIFGANVQKIRISLNSYFPVTYRSVVCKGDYPPTINRGAFSGKTLTQGILFVPKGAKDRYQNADVWKDFFDIQEMNETTAITSAIIKKEKSIVGRYNAGGQRLNTPQKGINIIKYSDGTTKKVIIK